MCDLCNLANSERVVGGDEALSVVVPKNTAPTIYIIAKQHAPLSELDEKTQQKLLSTASMLSSVVFDNMQVHGTNILLRDEQHAHAIVIGRTEEDGLDLRWKPNKATPQEIQDTAKKITEETWTIGKEKKNEEPLTYIEKTMNNPKPMVAVSRDVVVADKSAKTRYGYVDPDPEVDTPDEVARDIQTRVRKGPKKADNYMIKHLTRRR